MLYENYGASPEEQAYNEATEAIINSDFMTLSDLALRYRVDTGANKNLYAAKAVEILSAWAGISSWSTNPASILSWQDYWPSLLHAALLLEGAPSYTSGIRDSLRAKTGSMAADLLHPNGIPNAPTTAINNWSSVGVNAKFAVSSFLADRGMFEEAVYRWRQVFDTSVVSNFLGVDGELHDNVQWTEVYREGGGQGDGSYGLLYCNYDFSAYGVALQESATPLVKWK